MRVTLWPFAVSNCVYKASGACVAPAVAAAADGVPSAGWKLTKVMFAPWRDTVERQTAPHNANRVVFIIATWVDHTKADFRAASQISKRQMLQITFDGGKMR